MWQRRVNERGTALLLYPAGVMVLMVLAVYYGPRAFPSWLQAPLWQQPAFSTPVRGLQHAKNRR